MVLDREKGERLEEQQGTTCPIKQPFLQEQEQGRMVLVEMLPATHTTNKVSENLHTMLPYCTVG